MLKLMRTSATAGLLGLAALVHGGPVAAADMYDKYGPRTSSPYDDPRYADIYSYPAPPQPQPRYPEPRYIEPPPVPYREPHGRPYAYYEETQPIPRDRYGYLRPVNPRRPYFSEAPASACVPHGEIRRSLVSEGWSEFQDLEFRGEVAVVRARRPNGQTYALKVDRCSGEIVNARPLEERPVPYAYRERYGRTY